MVNIATIGDQKYQIDVGFGSNGPHKPIPVIQNYEFHNTGDLHTWAPHLWTNHPAYESGTTTLAA
jgi:hypothetical protein